MKMLFLIPWLVLGLILPCSAGIRGTEWGMSKQQVRKIEKSKLIEEKERQLAYESKITSLDTLIVFMFNHRNELYSIDYFITEKHVNKNRYIEDFERVNKILRNKYGKPERDEKLWRRNLYKNDRDKWGFAISIGDLTIGSEWKGKTNILHMLSGDNYRVFHFLTYSNTKLKKEYEAIIQQEKLKKEF